MIEYPLRLNTAVLVIINVNILELAELSLHFLLRPICSNRNG